MTLPGSSPRSDPPPHVASLRARIRNETSDELQATRLERTVALVVLGQILLSCETDGDDPAYVAAAVKGGTAMRLRYGPAHSRFSKDFDTARATDLETFVASLGAALARGWGGFAGDVRPSRSVARPHHVPPQYVMVAHEVKLRYGLVGTLKAFMTIPLEIGADELGDTVDPPRASTTTSSTCSGTSACPNRNRSRSSPTPTRSPRSSMPSQRRTQNVPMTSSTFSSSPATLLRAMTRSHGSASVSSPSVGSILGRRPSVSARTGARSTTPKSATSMCCRT